MESEALCQSRLRPEHLRSDILTFHAFRKQVFLTKWSKKRFISIPTESCTANHALIINIKAAGLKVILTKKIKAIGLNQPLKQHGISPISRPGLVILLNARIGSRHHWFLGVFLGCSNDRNLEWSDIRVDPHTPGSDRVNLVDIHLWQLHPKQSLPCTNRSVSRKWNPSKSESLRIWRSFGSSVGCPSNLSKGSSASRKKYAGKHVAILFHRIHR